MIATRDKRSDFRKKLHCWLLKREKKLDPVVTVVDLDSLSFDFMPVAFDICGAAEPNTLAYLDSFAKRSATWSVTSGSPARSKTFFPTAPSLALGL